MSKKRTKKRQKPKQRYAGGTTHSRKQPESRDNKRPAMEGWLLEALDRNITDQARERILTEAEQTILASVAALEALIEDHSSLDLIANLALSQLMRNPETYKEYLHQGDASIVEYVTLLLLKRPANPGPWPPQPLPLDEIIDAASRVKFQTTFLFGAGLLSEAALGNEPALLDLQFRAVASNLTVRSVGYPHHLAEDLRAIFAPSAPYLRSQLGFDVEQALAAEDALERLLQSKLMAAHESMSQQVADLLGKIDDADRNGWRTFVPPAHDENDEPDDEFVKMVLSIPRPKRKKLLRDYGLAWLSWKLGEVLTYSPDELAAESGLSVEVASKLLDFFSLEFGSQPADYAFFTTPHSLQLRPFIRNEGKYFYAIPGTLQWALKPRFEAALNPAVEPKEIGTKNVWAKYDKHRATYLENQTLDLLKRTLPNATCYKGLTYRRSVDGVVQNFELDGLLLYDRTILLMEAKAGASQPLGGPSPRRRLRQDVQKLIADAYNQGLRAQEYIESTDTPEFTEENGNQFRVDKSAFSRTILLTVSLDPLDVFHGSLHTLIEAGLLKKDQSLPWSVSLGNLKVVSDHMEFPTQLIDYILKRLSAVSLFKVYGHDELDWLSDYLENGLCFEWDQRLDSADRIMLSTKGSSDIDAYYSHQLGERQTPARMLRQKMPRRFKEMILELDRKTSWPGRTEAILALLDWGGPTRKELAKRFDQARALTRKDGEIHDAGIADDRAGITFLAVSNRSEAEGMARLSKFVHLKKYQFRLPRWTGFLTNVDSPDLISHVCLEDTPWKQNVQMDEVVRQFEALNRDPKISERGERR